MRILARIVEARQAGAVLTGSLPHGFASVEALASAFGLRADRGIYRLVAPAEATAVLVAVLHEDMAYGCEIVPLAEASRLARDFVAAFPAASTRFYTNGTFGVPRASPDVGPSWQPATDATFDTGVLASSDSLSACVWVKDED